MDRLTERADNGDAYIKGLPAYYVQKYVNEMLEPVTYKLAAYEDTGLTPEEIKSLEAEWNVNRDCLDAYRKIGSFEHLKELIEAEREGRCVVLPCKVGDMVYEPEMDRKIIVTYRITGFHLSRFEPIALWELVAGMYSNLKGFYISEIGKTVFLTRSEAEKAIKDEVTE